MQKQDGTNKINQSVMKGAMDIMNSNYDTINFVIDDILISSGLTLIAGAPKAGKSLFILQMLLAITGGNESFIGHQVNTKVKALYLALEDSEQRLQERIKKMGFEPKNNDLMIATKWAVDVKGIDYLDKWLFENEDFKVVVIDTKGRFIGGNATVETYQNDYAWMSHVKDIADKHKVSIVLITHFRKKPAALDDYESISGSSAIMGAADTAIMLKRARNQTKGVLCLTSRDFEEREEEIFLDPKTLTWHAANEIHNLAQEHMTPERHQILEALKKLGGPARPKDVAAITGRTNENTSNMLNKMVRDGLLCKSQTQSGYYELIDNSKEENND